MVDRDKTLAFEAADYLDSPEAIAEYINAAVEEGNEQLMLIVMQDVARAWVGVVRQAPRSCGLKGYCSVRRPG